MGKTGWLRPVTVEGGEGIWGRGKVLLLDATTTLGEQRWSKVP